MNKQHWTVYTRDLARVVATRWTEQGPGEEKVVKVCGNIAEADRQAILMQQDYDRIRRVVA